MKQEFVTLPREVVEQVLKAAEAFHSHYKRNIFSGCVPSEELYFSAARASLRAALEQPQANQPAMTPIAQRKLDSLLAEGYTIGGYSVYHEQKHQHGFVTGAGLVGWWKPDGVEYPQPKREPLTDEQVMQAVRHLYQSDFAAGMGFPDDLDVARAIEAAHNIK